MARWLEDEVRRLEEEIKALGAFQVRSVELTETEQEIVEFLARGERVPEELLGGVTELMAQFVRVLEEMIEEGYFDEMLDAENEED